MHYKLKFVILYLKLLTFLNFDYFYMMNLSKLILTIVKLLNFWEIYWKTIFRENFIENLKIKFDWVVNDLYPKFWVLKIDILRLRWLMIWMIIYWDDDEDHMMDIQDDIMYDNFTFGLQILELWNVIWRLLSNHFVLVNSY